MPTERKIASNRQNAPEIIFSLTRIFEYQNRIYDTLNFALVRENHGQRKPLSWYVLRILRYFLSSTYYNESIIKV